MQKSFSSVKIRCNALVKQYLENNFGSPVMIHDRHHLQKLACAQLFKHNVRPEGGSGYSKEYSEEIEFCLSYNNFRFDGFNINPMNARLFNVAVEEYIKDLCRTNLDSLMLSHDKQINWKEKLLNLVPTVKALSKPGKVTDETIRNLKRELAAHELNIKSAIDYVITHTLRLNYDVLNYERVKKDYWRYRNPDKYQDEKNNKKVGTPLSRGLDLFSSLEQTIN